MNELNKSILCKPLASIVFNNFNKFSTEPTQLIHFLSHTPTPKKIILIVKKENIFTDEPIVQCYCLVAFYAMFVYV